MRLILCLVLFGGSAAFGAIAADRLKKRTDSLSQVLTALDALSIRLQYYQEPLGQAMENVAKLYQQPSYAWISWMAKALKEGRTATAAFDGLLENKAPANVFREYLKQEDAVILKDLFERIGSHKEEQKAAFLLCQQRLSRQQEAAAQFQQTRGRRYRMMGILLGAIWVIIFL